MYLCEHCRCRTARHGTDCRCLSCRRSGVGREQVALEATPFPREPCGPRDHAKFLRTLPRWSGWCHFMPLRDLLGGTPAPPNPHFTSNREWIDRRQYPIYRFVANGNARDHRNRTLYVGLSHARNGSVQQRVRTHMNSANQDRGSKDLREHVNQAGSENVGVWLGTAKTPDPRLAHAVEILLQRAEDVLEWPRIRTTMTFDEFESTVSHALDDLRRRA